MSLLVLKITISLIVGFIWITASSVFAEKLGPRLGGVVAGLPATMVVALFFIGLIEGETFASQMTTVIPLAVAINSTFVVAFIALSKRLSVVVSLVVSLVFWFYLMFFISQNHTSFFSTNLVISFAIIFCSYFILEKIMKIATVSGKKITYNTNQIIVRGIIGGGVIGFSVIMSKLSGPVFAGIFASFPALTVAMILIIYRTQTVEFLHSLLKNFIISGTVNVIVFTTCIRFTFPIFGIYVGTVIALVTSGVTAYCMYYWIGKRLS